MSHCLCTLGFCLLLSLDPTIRPCLTSFQERACATTIRKICGAWAINGFIRDCVEDRSDPSAKPRVVDSEDPILRLFCEDDLKEIIEYIGPYIIKKQDLDSRRGGSVVKSVLGVIVQEVTAAAEALGKRIVVKPEAIASASDSTFMLTHVEDHSQKTGHIRVSEGCARRWCTHCAHRCLTPSW